VAEPGKVDGAGGVESLLQCAGTETGAQDGVLVTVVCGGVDREAEHRRRGPPTPTATAP
jgi:hypothetical protein